MIGDNHQAVLEGTNTSNPFLKFWIGSTIARAYNMCNVLLYCIAFYILSIYKQKNKLHWLFIILSYLVGLLSSLSTGTRGGIFYIVMIFIIQFFIYKEWMIQSLQNKIKKTLLIIIIFLTIILIFMSLTRFGNSAELYFYKYLGEPMINFNGLLYNNQKGTTEGMAYFWYIPSRLGLMDFAGFDNVIQKWEFIENKTGVSGQYFYTLWGGLLFEFGKAGTLIIAFIIHFILKKVYKNKTLLIKPILLSWLSYYIIVGTFFFPFQGDTGIMQIIFIILFYLWIQKTNRISN